MPCYTWGHAFKGELLEHNLPLSAFLQKGIFVCLPHTPDFQLSSAEHAATVS